MLTWSLAPEVRAVKEFPAQRDYHRCVGKEFRSLTATLAFERGLRQTVRLNVEFALDMRNRELQRTRQFATSPVQRVETRAATLILPGHLPHHHLRVGIDVQFSRLQRNRILQGFHQRCIFSDVVILMADPLGDADGALRQAADHYPNARRSWISQASTVYIGHQFWGHFDISLFLQDAPKQFQRQDDYLVPFQRFAVA